MPRNVRRARNRNLFRAVNEEIAGLAESQSEPGDGLVTQGFICECHRLGCSESLQVPLSVYRDVRDDPETFVVAPNHLDEEHEIVVGEDDGYRIVRLRAMSYSVDRGGGASERFSSPPVERIDVVAARKISA